MKKTLLKSTIWTIALTLLFLLITWNNNSTTEIITATIYFVLLYFVFLSVGKEEVADWLNGFVNLNLQKAAIFPSLLIIIYYSYLLIHGENPFQGTVFMIPFLIYFPTLVFVAKGDSTNKIDWLDFTTFTLFLLPTTLVEFSPDSNMPIGGGGLDSVYRIIIMLAIIYAFVVVRNLKDVGFFPVFKLKYLWTAIWVWLVFYGFVFAIAYAVNFFEIVGYNDAFLVVLASIGLSILRVFWHTAIFEELFFRGLLQNLLTKRIAQNKSWESFWKWGGAILITLSLITGYFMKGDMFWFPALITSMLFLAAYAIERSKISASGTYTALAITSVIFGLVHFHSGSIIFVGLASIGGWAYGYTYIKTKNVFYAALVHALVNSSTIIFGLELVK